MSDLRNKLIRLAHKNPELRKDLLPLIKVALTIEGRRLLQQVQRDGVVYPSNSDPFQLSSHPLLKSAMRYFLPHIYDKNPFLKDNNSGWKVQPSSIYVSSYINSDGLHLKVDDPNHKLRAKNTRSDVYNLRTGRRSNAMYVAPSLKRQKYGFHRATRIWYPIKIVGGKRYYTEGPHKGEENGLDGTGLITFAQAVGEYRGKMWIPKGKVSLFLMEPNTEGFKIFPLSFVGKSKEIQSLFSGGRSQQARLSYDDLRAIIEPKLRRVRYHTKVLPKGWEENGGVAIKHETEMDWEYNQNYMNRREFNAQFYGRMEAVKNALMAEFPDFEVKKISEYEDGKRIDYEIIER